MASDNTVITDLPSVITNQKGGQKVKSMFGLIVCIGILSILFSLVWVNNLPAQEKVIIQGTVYALDWDDEGNVMAVVIVADGVEYAVSGSGKGRELLALEGKTIKATGMVDVNEEGEKTITVTSYEVSEVESGVEEETIIIEEE